MSYKPLDDRQIVNRAVLQQIYPYISQRTLDVLMASINFDLTPPLSVTADNPADLTINVGPAIVNNTESNRNKSMGFVGAGIPSFSGTTVTFPSASGGNITTAQGKSFPLTLPSGDFVQILLSMDTSGFVEVNIGSPNAVEANALVPTPNGSNLPFAYVTLQNISGTIQNVTQSNIFQFSGSAGSGSGSGTGSKNYLTSYTASTSSNTPNTGNGNFEFGNTNGWSLAHVAFTTANGYFQPTGVGSAGSGFSSSNGGTSASGNLSFGVINSGQLAGSYSGDLVSSAASTQGDLLISNSFFIDAEDQGKAITIKFYYEAASGASNLNFSGTSSNSFAIWIYDVTNAAWIMPAGVYNLVQNSGAGYSTGTFQTTINSTQYQIALVNINASSGSYSLYVDDFFVGPETAPIGSAMSDWQSYSLTVGATTTPPTQGAGAVNQAWWRRVGDSMEIMFNYAQTSGGSNGSGTYLFPLPPGYSIDTTKVTASTGAIGTGGDVIGSASLSSTSSSATISADTGVVIPYNSNNLQVIVGYNTTNELFPWSSSWFQFNITTLYGSFIAKVPIAGWSSNTSMSNDTDTRVVAASVTSAAADIPVTSGNPIVFPVVIFDTHGAYSTSTGLYTIPISGYYAIEVSGFNGSGPPIQYFIYKNGAFYKSFVSYSVGGSNVSGSTKIQCNTGDTVAIVPDTTGSLTYGAGLYTPVFSVSRLSGPAVVAATESVNAKYNTSSQTVGAVDSAIVATVKEFDSHNAYSTSTGLYTVPVSGKYRISGYARASSSITSSLINLQVYLSAYQNGSLKSELGRFNFQETGTALGPVVNGTTTLQCNAGDTLSVDISRDSGVSSFSLPGDSSGVWVSFERIGN